MFNLLKYIPLLLYGRDIADAYKKEQGKDKPAYLSKTFIGAIMAAVVFALAKYKGITIDDITINAISNHIYVVLIGVYNLFLLVKGIYDKVKNGK